VYDLSFINDEALNTAGCSQYNGGTIAPVPSSVLAAVSAFNATYTGVILGPSNTATGGTGPANTATGGTGAPLTTGSGATKSGSSSTPRNTGSSSSLSFAQFTVTLNGGSPGTTTAPTSTQGGVETSTSSTTLKAGSGSGGAQSWNTGVALVFSVVACGISILCLC
jgi:hypothetical protein